jgi:hypothetical protein
VGHPVAPNLEAGFLAGPWRGGCWTVAEQAAPSFGGLLRQLRVEARLTQEELAEAAQTSSLPGRGGWPAPIAET